MAKVIVVVLFAILFLILIIRLGRHFLFEHADLIDTHRTRMPLILATAAAAIFCLAGIFLGIAALSLSHDLGGSWLLAFLGGLLILPAVSAALSYLFLMRLFNRRLRWRTCENHEWGALIAGLAREMGLPSIPKITVSEMTSLPMVLGRSRQSSVLVLPAGWVDRRQEPGRVEVDATREFQLYHELSHLRNGDVGFTTWAFAYVRIAAIPAVAIPTFAVICAVTGGMSAEMGWAIAGPSLFSFSLLWLLYRVVLRQREFDADARVGAVTGWAPESISRILEQCDPIYSTAPYAKPNSEKVPWSSRLELWFADKAAFGFPRWLWSSLDSLVRCLVRTHPSVSQRQAMVLARPSPKAWTVPSLAWAVCAGLDAGLIIEGLLIALVAPVVLWVKDKANQDWIGTQVAIPACFMMIVAILPIAVSFLVLLPSRFSEEAGPMPLGYVRRVAVWLFVVLLSASCVFLTVKDFFPEVGFIILLVVCFSMVFVLTLAALSGALREWRLSPAKLFNSKDMVLIVSLLLAGLGELIVPGILIPIGIALLAGTVLVVGPEQRTSWEEGFAIRRRWGKEWLVEGWAFRRKGKLAITAIDFWRFTLPTLVLAAGVGLVYCIARGPQLHKPISDMQWNVSLVILGIAMVPIMVFLARRYRGLKPGDLARIAHCTKMLMQWRHESLAKYQKVFDSLANAVVKQERWLGLVDLRRLKTLEEILDCLASQGQHDKVSARLKDFVAGCQFDQGGFGIWPGASCRLSGMFYSLKILHTLNALDHVDKTKHLNWLAIVRQQDGAFSDPLLQYPVWKQTYWGFNCVHWLNGPRPILSPSVQQQLSQGLRRCMAVGKLTEEVFMSLWCLKTAGAQYADIERQLAAFCELRINRLLEQKTTWVIDEYAVLLEMTQFSQTVADRVSCLVPGISERIERAMDDLMRNSTFPK